MVIPRRLALERRQSARRSFMFSRRRRRRIVEISVHDGRTLLVSRKEPLRKCIWGFPAPGAAEAMAVRWPQRAEQPPSRLREAPAAGLERAKDEAYEADLRFWKSNVDVYVTGFGEQRVREIRNVLDMNAGYGGYVPRGDSARFSRMIDYSLLCCRKMIVRLRQIRGSCLAAEDGCSS